MMDQALGARIRALREQRGWSQHHLGRVADVSERTVQRIEQFNCAPRAGTLQALAAAFDLDVSSLRTGFSAEKLAEFEEGYLCPHCGAPLEERTFVQHEYGDAELEVFACGHRRGADRRPCPKDPRFPKFEDYDLTFFPEDEEAAWYCMAIGRTESAREVALDSGYGRSRDEAKRWVERSYILARDGYKTAEAFWPMGGTSK